MTFYLHVPEALVSGRFLLNSPARDIRHIDYVVTACKAKTREASDYKRSIRLQEKNEIQDKQQMTNPTRFLVFEF